MTRQLLLIHGRAQEAKDSVALKAEWLDALEEGLEKNGLSMPIQEKDVRFPFYGDTLYDLGEGMSKEEASAVIVRGDNADEEQRQFIRAVLEEIRKENGITEAQLAATAGQEVVARGIQNWEWFQGILKVLDRHVPYASSGSIALFTQDAYQYLKNSVIRKAIDDGVTAAFTPGAETVVVAHSLGTIIAYNILRQKGQALGLKVPLLITLGSPLAIEAIYTTLKKSAPIRCPDGVATWFNAMDERDVVALYPLDQDNFPLNPAQPAIENKRNVRNNTENHHGIGGYLNNKEVAKRIHDALVA